MIARRYLYNLLICCVAGALLAAGCANNQTVAPAAPGDYYPLAVGDTWTYQMRPGTKVYTAQVTATRVIASVATYALAIEDTYSFVAERPDGIYEYGQGEPGHPQNAVLFSPAERLYKLPFVVGDTWETPVLAEPASKNGDQVSVEGQVDGIESVTVPAGTFAKCAKVTIDDPRDAPADRTDLWLAPNVGIIKTVTYITIGAGKPKTTITELVRYHLAGK